MSLEERMQRIETILSDMRTAMVVLAIIVAALVADRLAGQEIGKAIATPADAVGWALGDLATVPASDRPFTRYVWLPPWADERWMAALNFSVNTAASHSPVIQLATPTANGWLLRYDLQVLAPDVVQLQRLVATWDGLALQDPYFHVHELNSKIPAAVLAPHLRQQEAVALAGLSLSTGAIYRADFLLYKMLSTLEGGKYYDFLQVQRQVSKDTNPQSVFLASLGVFEATTKNLSADKRSALIRSGVTGKPRRIDFLFGVFGNPASITHDIADEDVDPDQHPLLNLLQFDDRAREVIVARPNGTHAFALFDDRGDFQDSVPDNIAHDDTIPAPHTKRLQPAISCIRCHGPFDGYKPFQNEVAQVLSSGIQVALELDGLHLTYPQVKAKLEGLYAGRLDVPDGVVGRARRDYSAAIYRISGSAYASPVIGVSEHVSQIYASYRYAIVTPERACLEIGLSVDPGQGIAGLRQLLGTNPNAPVGATEALLRSGISVNRVDFERDYADFMLSANRNRKGR